MRLLTSLLLVIGLMTTASAAELIKVKDPVPDSYVVVLKADSKSGLRLPLLDNLVDDLLSLVNGTLQLTFDTVLNGFSVQVDSTGLSKLLQDPRVAYVEQNARMKVQQTRQSDASWGLDRIDQRSLPLDGDYSYASAGQGAHVYILDSGLRSNHSEFTGRVGNGFSTVGDNRGVGDCTGHGTAVAAVAAGSTYGVAKRATVHPVRVVNCEGFSTSADIIAGIDWIVNNQQTPAVVNVSLGSVSSRSTMEAVRNATARGVLFVVAAGNQGADACAFSPGNTPVALTVGASTKQDARASFSNLGRCVDVFAPGENILSAGSSSSRATSRLSGTSLASPFVAGVAALYRADNRNASPQQVSTALVQNATEGRLNNLGGGSPNRLLYSTLGQVAPAPERSPPPVPNVADPAPAPTPTPGQEQPQQPAPTEPSRRERDRPLCDLPLLGGLCR